MILEINFPFQRAHGASHGKNCMFECHCSGSSCNPETGACVCQAGRHGETCDRRKCILIHYIALLSVMYV